MTAAPRRRSRRASADSEAEFVCACATARQVARSLTQLYDSWLRAASLEAPQFALMAALSQGDGANQAGLARRFALDKTTMSRNVRLLEREGLVARTSGRDRRERRLTLTAEGRARLQAARPAWRLAQQALRATMSGPEWNAMLRAFRTVGAAAAAAARGDKAPMTRRRAPPSGRQARSIRKM